MKYIAYVTKGLEAVTKLELQQKLGAVSIEEIEDKRVIFETSSGFDDLIKLKTVDDLGVLIGKIPKIKDSSELISLLSEEPLQKVRDFVKNFREVNDKSFSITVSVAKSSLKTLEISSRVRDHLANNLGWEHIGLDRTNFDIRIFIDGKQAYTSVRLTKESLHNRVYKNLSKPGSLKPTVAASMVILATNFQKSLKIVDNFCGSGTILCEAYLLGNDVWGGDIDPESVTLTRTNLGNLYFRYEDRINVLDARSTKWPENYFDCAISNLPWDKQIEVKSITDIYENSIKEYLRILKPTGTLCAIVTKPELFVKYIKKFKPDAKIKSIKIGLLGQNPTIVIAN